MTKLLTRNWTILLATLVGTFLLDFVTKTYAAVSLGSPLNIISDFFRLVYAENRGIAFSLPLEGPVLIAITIVAIVLVIAFFGRQVLHSSKWHGSFFFALFLGGALGNLFDRLTKGFVIDFIAIGNFPIFNIADTALTVAVLWFALYELFLKKD